MTIRRLIIGHAESAGFRNARHVAAFFASRLAIGFAAGAAAIWLLCRHH